MRIALTGGIASGKSTILHLLRERGVSVFSADAIARDILWEPRVQDELARRFGLTLPIGPPVLKELLSADDETRRAVNRIMHPAIADAIDQAQATVYEIPLLFETCLHVEFDAIWVAFCSRETQTKRLVERYGRADGFDQFSWQIDSKVALAFADSVISTDGDLEGTKETLLQEAKRWRVTLVVS